MDKLVNYLNHLSNMFLGPETYSIYHQTVNSLMATDILEKRGSKRSSSVSRYLASAYDMCERMYPTKFKSYRRGGLLYASLYTWIQSKIVYSFDSDVECSLIDMSWSDLADQPVNILSQLPVNSFGIQFNSPFHSEDGFCFDSMLVFNDYKLDNDGKPYGSASITFLLIDSSTRKGEHCLVPIGFLNIEPTEGFPPTFQSLYDANVAENLTSGMSPESYKSVLTRLLPYVLYLCSQNAEISQPAENQRIYRPYTITPKHKYREVKQLVCGEPTGTRIRNFKKLQRERHECGEGSMKCPHVRRAHYHRYWVGKGKNRHLELRWISPCYIHKDLNRYIKSTNARVKQSYT